MQPVWRSPAQIFERYKPLRYPAATLAGRPRPERDLCSARCATTSKGPLLMIPLGGGHRAPYRGRAQAPARAPAMPGAVRLGGVPHPRRGPHTATTRSDGRVTRSPPRWSCPNRLRRSPHKSVGSQRGPATRQLTHARRGLAPGQAGAARRAALAGMPRPGDGWRLPPTERTSTANFSPIRYVHLIR